RRSRSVFPPGVALRLSPVPDTPGGPPAGLGFTLDGEWVNGTPRTRSASALVVLHRARPKKVTHIALPFADRSAEAGLLVAPGEVASTEALAAGRQAAWGPGRPGGPDTGACVLQVTGQMHKRGRFFGVDLIGADGTVENPAGGAPNPLEPGRRRSGVPTDRLPLPRPHVHRRVPARKPGRGSDARGRGVPAGRDLRTRRSRGRMPAMISVRRAGVLLLLLLAPSAPAHIVPVPPSTCVFDPVTVEAPMSGVVGAAAPPEPADQFQIFYDPAASQATFDMQSVPPRSFTAAGVDGTFALPGLVVGTLISSGDLTLTTSLAFPMSGGTTTVPITLTTGLAAAAAMVVAGMPIASDARL